MANRSAAPLARVLRAMTTLLAATLVAGLLVPIYTDEVAWRLQLSRFVEDGGVDRAVGETCGPNTIAVPPLFMWPVRIFSSAVTWAVTDPIVVRVAGIATALAAVALVRAVARRLFVAPRTATATQLLAVSLLGLGLLPFLMVWSRPEQPLLLALLAAVLLALPPAPARRGVPGIRLAGIVAAGLVALAYHLKAVAYLPVFFAALALAPAGLGDRRRWRDRLARLAAAAILAWAAWLAFRYWSQRFACPRDPVLAAKLARENASILLLGQGWRGLVGAIPQLVGDMSPRHYLHATLPIPPLMSDWLPPPPIDGSLREGWVLLCEAGWAMAALLGIRATWRAARDPARRRGRLLLGLAVLLSATGWAALQINKNAYEAVLYIPAMMLAGLLLWSASAREDKLAEPLVAAVALLSAASQALLLGTYVPALWPTTRGGYIPGQPFSVSGFRYAPAAVAAAGARCGLAPAGHPRRVLVDDLTYFAYARTATPLYRLGVLSSWNGSITDPGRWLHDHGSPGAVLACAWLPPGLRARAIASGPICCVSTR